jgi:DNA-binding GntR family transcriptional regulator
MDTSNTLHGIPSPDRMQGKTVHERVREALRSSVLDGALPSNYRLRQTELAEYLGVSVTPVREALRDLAAEGLIRMDPHRGAVVADMSLEEFVEIRLLMEALERVWAQLVVRNITDDDLARADLLQQRLEANPDEYLTVNPAFHDLLTTAARAPRLAAMLAALRGSSEAVVRRAVGHKPTRVAEGIEEHVTLMAALHARDAEAVAEAILAHFRPTWDVVEGIMRAAEENPEYD